MKLIEEYRLAELMRSEAKLNALISNGVDNWEYYGESLCNDIYYNKIRGMSDSQLTACYENAQIY